MKEPESLKLYYTVFPDEPMFMCCDKSQFVWRCNEHNVEMGCIFCEWLSDERCNDGTDKHPYDPENSSECPICGKITGYEGHWMWADPWNGWKCEGNK